MFTSAPATASHLHELGIHPLAAQMRDIILAKAVDGQPTMAEDLGLFTSAEIAAHLPTAKTLANKQIVRQLDDGRGFESRAQLLTRVTLLLLAKMPNEITLHATLRAHSLTDAEIAELWDDLMATTADAFIRSRPLPQLRAVQ